MERRQAGCFDILCNITFIVFLVLKLTGTVTWSWWAITAPLWMPIAALFPGLMLCWVIPIAVNAIRRLLESKD